MQNPATAPNGTKKRQRGGRPLGLPNRPSNTARDMLELASLVDRLVARRIRDRRIALGKTQQWLAKRIGMTAQQIHKYERGSSRITCGRLAQFAEVLDMALDDLFAPQRRLGKTAAGRTALDAEEA